MKYLINSFSKKGETREGCGYDDSGCTYLCITFCLTKVENCPRPLGVGFSPSANDDNISDTE